jgi:hypothetical protein
MPSTFDPSAPPVSAPSSDNDSYNAYADDDSQDRDYIQIDSDSGEDDEELDEEEYEKEATATTRTKCNNVSRTKNPGTNIANHQLRFLSQMRSSPPQSLSPIGPFFQLQVRINLISPFPTMLLRQ